MRYIGKAKLRPAQEGDCTDGTVVAVIESRFLHRGRHQFWDFKRGAQGWDDFLREADRAGFLEAGPFDYQDEDNDDVYVLIDRRHLYVVTDEELNGDWNTSDDGDIDRWHKHQERFVLLLRADAIKRGRADERALEEARLLVNGPAATPGRRRPIPDDVRMFVWRRDEARCVRCSTQADLEFDHVIPLSMGGSDTARNLQLLCGSCNRSKGGNLV